MGVLDSSIGAISSAGSQYQLLLALAAFVGLLFLTLVLTAKVFGNTPIGKGFARYRAKHPDSFLSKFWRAYTWPGRRMHGLKRGVKSFGHSKWSTGRARKKLRKKIRKQLGRRFDPKHVRKTFNKDLKKFKKTLKKLKYKSLGEPLKALALFMEKSRAIEMMALLDSEEHIRMIIRSAKEEEKVLGRILNLSREHNRHVDTYSRTRNQESLKRSRFSHAEIKNYSHFLVDKTLTFQETEVITLRNDLASYVEGVRLATRLDRRFETSLNHIGKAIEKAKQDFEKELKEADTKRRELELAGTGKKSKKKLKKLNKQTEACKKRLEALASFKKHLSSFHTAIVTARNDLLSEHAFLENLHSISNELLQAVRSRKTLAKQVFDAQNLSRHPVDDYVRAESVGLKYFVEVRVNNFIDVITRSLSWVEHFNTLVTNFVKESNTVIKQMADAGGKVKPISGGLGKTTEKVIASEEKGLRKDLAEVTQDVGRKVEEAGRVAKKEAEGEIPKEPELTEDNPEYWAKLLRKRGIEADRIISGLEGEDEVKGFVKTMKELAAGEIETQKDFLKHLHDNEVTITGLEGGA